MKKRITTSVIEFAIFSVLGGLGVIAFFAIQIVLTDIYKVNFVISMVVGFLANTIISFPVHKYITFKHKKQKRKTDTQLILFSLVSLIYFLINLGSSYIGINEFNIYYIIPQLPWILIFSLFNFRVNNWIFE